MEIQIFYVDVHNQKIETMTLNQFLSRFNADELDTSECFAFTDFKKAESVLEETLFDCDEPFLYEPSVEIFVKGEANPKYQNLSSSEVDQGFRTIGGDKGDLLFKGYKVENGLTVLYKPQLRTLLDLDQDEVDTICQEVLDFAFDSIQFEALGDLTPTK